MWVILAILLGVSFAAQADVYKCERTDGFIYYQDSHCKSQEDKQTKLLTFIEPVPDTTILNLKRRNTQKVKEQKTQAKKRNKQVASATKQRERKRKQCVKIKSDIALIESESRSGYTAKRGKVLKRRKDALIAKKELYCDHNN